MLRIQCNFSLARRQLSSALYITGDKAKEQYAPLVPYLDFRTKLADLEGLQRNLQLRRYQLDFDQLKQQWELYRSIEARKKDIEAKRVKLREQFASTTCKEQLHHLRLQATLARDDLKALRESSYAIADSFVAGNFLAIPNELDERTPSHECAVLHEYNSSCEKNDQIGDEWLEEYDSTCYYMTEDAALFDLFLPMRCANHFQDAGYVLFSNPDFVRSVIVEAAREDLASVYLINEEVDLEHKLNLLHLCGGASMLSFLGYLTKLSIFPTTLPLRLVALGKQYFYEKVQTSAVQTLAAATNRSEAIALVDETVELYKAFYDKLDLTYRLVNVAAHKLKPAEAMRIDVELFSPKVNDFVRVGDICYYMDFISKRIAFNYHEGKVQKFPHLVSGTVLSATDVIKILLQHGVRFKELSLVS